MLQINLTIKGTNTVLRTWKADVNISLLEMADLVALLKLIHPPTGIYGVEVIVEQSRIPKEFLITSEVVFGGIFDDPLADLKEAFKRPRKPKPDWEKIKQRIEEAKTVSDLFKENP